MSLWDLSYSQLPSLASPPGTPKAQTPTRPPAAAPSRTSYGPSSSKLSLETWEQLCPLNDSERQSVSALQAAIPDRPPPPHLKLSAQRNGLGPLASSGVALLRRTHGSRPDLAAAAFDGTLVGAAISRPSSPSTASGVDSGLQEPDDASEPVSTIEAFNDWFSGIAKLMDADSESRYRNHLAVIANYLASCDRILEQLEDSRGHIREVEANWRFVNENSQSMERACEGLLVEQKQLDALARSLTERLEYFRRLENAQKLLSQPGEGDLVRRDEFMDMLDGLDVCLEFMRVHSGFRDFDLYLVRFQQCLTRAMTLVKLHFVTTIESTSRDVSEKISGKDVSENALSALLFTKFVALASSLNPLVFELEKRSRINEDEYASLLAECHTTWFSCRRSVISSRVAVEVARMDPAGRAGQTHLVSLTRAGCNYVRSVCEREHELFLSFFRTSGRDDLYLFLESICDHLYDVLRPRILHELRLDVLCELCTVLQALMALDVEHLDSDVALRTASHSPSVIDDDGLKTGVSQSSPELNPFRFSPILQPLIQDVQTRLVFRAQAIIESDVLRHTPKADDLDYPARLKNKSSNMKSLDVQDVTVEADGGGDALRFKLPPDTIQEMWYPTLRRTMWVLSKVHTYVNNAVFVDFAGEAVGLCRQSLHNASLVLSNQSLPTSLMDAQLFSIRHLLILKEMIRTVDLVQIDRAVDLRPVTDALADLLKHTTAIFRPNTLFQIAAKGVPSFAETMKDAKLDLDNDLKLACAQFISLAKTSLCSGLLTYVSKCGDYLAASVSQGKDLPSQDWATAESVIKLYQAYMKHLEEGIPALKSQALLYLESERTVSVLLGPLQSEVFELYNSFYKIVRAEYNFTTTQTLLLPSHFHDKLASLSK